MTLRSIVVLSSAMLVSMGSTAFAQSGQLVCEQDLRRIEDLYREKQSVLSDTERAEALQLLEGARSKCSSEGSGGLTGRSREASRLLDKLENTPSPSQATVPPSR